MYVVVVEVEVWKLDCELKLKCARKGKDAKPWR